MRNSYLFTTCCIFLLTVSVGCKQEAEMPFFKTNLQPDSDGIVRDIPQDHKSAHKQYLKRKFESSLGLKDLQNGIKGLEIRIGERGGFTYKGRLFLLRNDGKSWKGELYYFRDSFSHAGEEGNVPRYEGATAIEKQELKQTSREWKLLVNKLLELEIDKLRDYSQIPGFGLNSDEDVVLVEVAQDSFYKVYHILTPSIRAETIKDAKQVIRMLELIDQKFGNKLKDSTYPNAGLSLY